MEPIDMAILRARVRAAVMEEMSDMSAEDVRELVMTPWLDLRDALRS